MAIAFMGNGQLSLYLKDIPELASLLPPKTWMIVVEAAEVIKEEGLT
jgi:hypothetical protein